MSSNISNILLIVQFEVIMFIEMFGNQKKMKRYNVIMNQTMITIPSTDSGPSTARNLSVYKIFARSWSHNNCYS